MIDADSAFWFGHFNYFFSVLAYQKINMISLLKKMELCANKIVECEVDS